jgi:TetR/AcrR family acrAB operon transcriptional repressor
MPVKTSNKRTRRGPLTRQQILDASLRLFSERGFARTTVRDIARQAGITDAAIYYHFESKRELLEALVEERGFLTSLQNLEQVEAQLPLREMVLWMAAGAINLMDENRDFLRLVIMEGLGGDEAALEQYTRLLDLWESALTAVLRRYEGKGELHIAAPADELARQIIYTILMAFQDSLLGRHGFFGPTSFERQSAIRDFLGPSLQRLLDGAANNVQA